MNLERSTLERKERSELATIAEALGRKPASRAKKSDIVDLILELAGVTEATAASADAGDGEVDAIDDATAGSPSDASSAGTDADDDSESPTPSASGASQDLDVDRGSDDAGSGASDTGSRRPTMSSRAIPSPPSTGSRSSSTDERGSAAGRSGASQQSGNQQGGQQGGGQQAGGRQSGPSGGRQQGGQASGREQGGNQQSGQSANQQDNNQQDNNQQGNQGSGNQSSGNQSAGNQNGNDGGAYDLDDDGEGGNKRRRRRRGRERGGEPGGETSPDWEGETVEVSGLLDLREDGYGFLRVNGFLPSRDDVYVSVKQCRQLGLRKGDHITGMARPAGRQEKNPSLVKVDTVNGLDPEQARSRPRFDDLTPLYPDSPLKLENTADTADMTGRVIDLIAPIGKGQRGLIVSPPKAGKTFILKQIANAIEANNPDVHLIVLLIDERPEEVTDFRRSISGGEVVASTFDRPAEEHTMVAELTIEHAKRMVEYGNDVVIILDGITRLARAYNLSAPPNGRVMSGGIDTGALYAPKKFFGAARNVEEGGSLTILATALVETGSAMDTVIFEEFTGTANMELRLDRRAADQGTYPAIDLESSSTRHEERLSDPKNLAPVVELRRALTGLAAEGGSRGSLELLIERMRSFPTDDTFIAELAKAPATPPAS